MANRLRECGCTATGLDEAIRSYQEENNEEIFLKEFGEVEFNDLTPVAQAAIVLGDIVLPPQPNADGEITKRGFELATWDDRDGLPPGCRYADTGEETQSLVLCDITAGDLLGQRQRPQRVLPRDLRQQRCRPRTAARRRDQLLARRCRPGPRAAAARRGTSAPKAKSFLV